MEIEGKNIKYGQLRACAYVDLGAIEKNLYNMYEHLGEDSKLMAVIKTNGYGHGAVPIAKKVEPLPFLFGFAVATAKEALELRENNITKPILILGYVFKEELPALILNDVRTAVFTDEMLADISNTVRELKAEGKLKKDYKYPIHIKVDTGMGRIGIFPDESGLVFIKKALDYKSEIDFEGIFTHFARADEIDKACAKKQLSAFTSFIARIESEANLYFKIKHAANSASIIELKEAKLDMCRAGIILYGLMPSNEVNKDIVKLYPALSLKSHVVFVKDIKKDTPVSYGGTFVANRDMRIATIPIGYGDGYPRALSNKGYVLIKGQKANILGRVCMDQMMVDVSEIEDVKVCDEVTLIGKDGENEITMELLGDMSGRFNYELACDLTARVQRVYI